MIPPWDYDWGYGLLLSLQSSQNLALDWLFVSVTALGNKEFYLLSIPFLYWCVDKKLGVRITFIFLSGMFFNSWMKYWVSSARPDPAHVRVLFSASGGDFSFPSGHAQGSVAFWGYLALWAKNWRFTAAAAVLVFLICMSRMYLGVHFPWDVAYGALIGVLTLIFFFVLLELYEKIKARFPWPAWIIAVVALTLVMTMLFPQKRFQLILGGLMGFLTGAILEARWIRLQMRPGKLLMLQKWAVGMATAVVITWCAGRIFQGSGLRAFAAYTVAGFWTSFGAPALFKKWKWG